MSMCFITCYTWYWDIWNVLFHRFHFKYHWWRIMLRVVIRIVLLMVVKIVICYFSCVVSPTFDLSYLFNKHQISMYYLCGIVVVESYTLSFLSIRNGWQLMWLNSFPFNPHNKAVRLILFPLDRWRHCGAAQSEEQLREWGAAQRVHGRVWLQTGTLGIFPSASQSLPRSPLWFPCFSLVRWGFRGEPSVLNMLPTQQPADCECELLSLASDQDFF